MSATRVLIAGGCSRALSLAQALAGRGCAVTLHEPDPHDAARLADMLRAAGAEGVAVSGRPGAGFDVTIVTRGAVPSGGSVINLAADAEPSAQVAAADLAGPAASPAFIEHWGGPAAPVEWLAQVLGVPLASVPGPVTQDLRAVIEDTAEVLVFCGATPWELDDALHGAGWAMGPCLMQDAQGLDSAYARHRAQDAAGTRRHGVPLIDRMVPEGRLGRKGGVGWYRYPGGGGPVTDPLVQDLALEEAHFARHTVQDISADTVQHAMSAALARWALGKVAQGFAAADLDRAATALGLPTARFDTFNTTPETLASQLRTLSHGLHPFWSP